MLPVVTQLLYNTFEKTVHLKITSKSDNGLLMARNLKADVLF